jgi:hypothetical protein
MQQAALLQPTCVVSSSEQSRLAWFRGVFPMTLLFNSGAVYWLRILPRRWLCQVNSRFWQA